MVETNSYRHIWDYEIKEWVKDQNTLKREEQEREAVERKLNVLERALLD